MDSSRVIELLKEGSKKKQEYNEVLKLFNATTEAKKQAIMPKLKMHFGKPSFIREKEKDHLIQEVIKIFGAKLNQDSTNNELLNNNMKKYGVSTDNVPKGIKKKSIRNKNFGLSRELTKKVLVCKIRPKVVIYSSHYTRKHPRSEVFAYQYKKKEQQPIFGVLLKNNLTREIKLRNVGDSIDKLDAFEYYHLAKEGKKHLYDDFKHSKPIAGCKNTSYQEPIVTESDLEEQIEKINNFKRKEFKCNPLDPESYPTEGMKCNNQTCFVCFKNDSKGLIKCNGCNIYQHKTCKIIYPLELQWNETASLCGTCTFANHVNLFELVKFGFVKTIVNSPSGEKKYKIPVVYYTVNGTEVKDQYFPIVWLQSKEKEMFNDFMKKNGKLKEQCNSTLI